MGERGAQAPRALLAASFVGRRTVGNAEPFACSCVCGKTLKLEKHQAGRLAFCGRCDQAVIAPTENGGDAFQFTTDQETPELVISLGGQKDWKRIHAVTSDEENYKYEISEPDSAKDLKDYLASVRFPHGVHVTGIFQFKIERKSDGELVGIISLTLDHEYATGTLGFMIHHLFAGQGFGTEAVTELVQFGFKGLGLHRIASMCDATNEPCMALLRKTGFTHEGCMRESVRTKKRGWVDVAMFSWLARDYG